ncbi:hypothetical protein Moror_11519 [Moniliophthora roreri MCA 2997]|uniref:Uncharacterized protein n=2 Tax=Moniliophthora roreri TaxID=221103 RepID=V2WTX2_MONRO|nr:hypothetical protein Moror_11519 [Moniliophthora roreri MCA 2997]KAI3596456.1 hypothetical protein WG66_003239 [Moniliophthora roreri]
MSNNSFSAAVENELKGIDDWVANLCVSIATGDAGAAIAETDLLGLFFGPDTFNEKEDLGLAQGEEWLDDLASPSHLSTSTSSTTEPSEALSDTISDGSSNQEDDLMLPLPSLLTSHDAMAVGPITTDLEDTLSTSKDKGKARADVDADVPRSTGRPKSGSLSLLRKPANVVAPGPSTSQVVKENHIVSGSADSSTPFVRRNADQVLGKRRLSTDNLFEEIGPAHAHAHAAAASDYSFLALQNQDPLHSAIQGSVYPTHDQHTSLLPQLDAASNFAPFQGLPQLAPSSNTGSFDSAYLPSTDFYVSLDDGLEAPSTSQRPIRPLPIRTQSGYLSHNNKVPLAQGWHNSQLHRNDHSRDGLFAPRCPNAPGILPQPNDTYINGNVNPYQNLYEYGTVSQAYCPQGSQQPYGNRYIKTGPSSVYPTHSQHEIVGQISGIAHPAPSNLDHAPRLPATHYLDATAPSTSNSTVSTPASSSSVTSRSRPGEPEEILYVIEDVPCKWVISGPGEPIKTCGRPIRPNENPADHVRLYHPPEHRRGAGRKEEWFCQWKGCQRWTSAALKRHLDGDGHTMLGRRVCGKCGRHEARFERIKKGHVNCTPGMAPKAKKKRKIEA